MNTLWWMILALLTLVSILSRNNLLFLLSLFLVLMGGVSVLWTRTCLTAVSYTRHFGTQRLFLGEETEFTVEIVNAKPLPLAWLRTEDELPAQALELGTTKLTNSHISGRARLVNLLSLRWYERVTRRYRLRGIRRGAWRIGPLQITSGDIFGFATRQELLEDQALILVYPKLVPLTALGLPTYRPFGDQSTLRRLVEDPLRLMGAREYTHGDSFRHIHWKATARRQVLQTKVFEPSASLPLAIFLNINTYEFLFEGRDSDLQEYAISTAASLARWAWDNGHPVGLYVNSIAQPGAQRIRLRPTRQADQLLQILEALAKVVDYGRWPIEAILQTETAHLPYGTSVVLVSATANARLQQTLLDLRARNFGVTLVGLGDKTHDLQLPGVRHYHIGGKEEWHDLATLALAA
jgi:uncharacterized protein (DUF58 family)